MIIVFAHVRHVPLPRAFETLTLLSDETMIVQLPTAGPHNRPLHQPMLLSLTAAQHSFFAL